MFVSRSRFEALEKLYSAVSMEKDVLAAKSKIQEDVLRDLYYYVDTINGEKHRSNHSILYYSPDLGTSVYSQYFADWLSRAKKKEQERLEREKVSAIVWAELEKGKPRVKKVK